MIKTGTATITVKVGAGTNYNAPSNKTFTVKAEFVPAKATLDTMSWADIRKVSDAGIAKDYWAVGDAKGLQINGTVSATSINQKVYAFILGFDHNSGREGTNRVVPPVLSLYLVTDFITALRSDGNAAINDFEPGLNGLFKKV